MTTSELNIYKIIQQNPSISQNEIAQKLNISRSSVATHIANLTKKGYILGRRYILNNSDNVVTIGGCSISILGKTKHELSHRESVPGEIINTFGGVALLTSVELSKMAVDVKFISAVGNDIHGKEIMSFLQEHNIRNNDIYINPNI